MCFPSAGASRRTSHASSRTCTSPSGVAGAITINRSRSSSSSSSNNDNDDKHRNDKNNDSDDNKHV